MTKFIPTDDQILDHHLGLAEPGVSSLVTAYLKDHPEKARLVKEWEGLEESFQAFPLKSPKEDILNRVRLMAREEVSFSAAQPTWVQKIFATFTVRQWALSFSLVVVVALSLMVRQSENHHRKVDGNYLKAARTTVESETSETATQVNDALNATLESEYNQALDNYHAGNFHDAHKSFSRIMSQNPAFDKRQELYTYWVETLKKLGKYDLAVKKQKILEEIQGQEP